MQATQAAQVETAFCLVPANKLCQGFAKYWLYVSSQCGLMEYWTEQPNSLQFNKGFILLSQFLCFSSHTTKPRTFLVDILQSRLQQTVRRHNGAKLHLHIQTLQREALHCWHSRGQIWTLNKSRCPWGPEPTDFHGRNVRPQSFSPGPSLRQATCFADFQSCPWSKDVKSYQKPGCELFTAIPIRSGKGGRVRKAPIFTTNQWVFDAADVKSIEIE